MLWIFAACLAGLLSGLLLTPLAISMLSRWDVVDRPDSERKLHARVVPVGGGVAVCAAMLIGSLCGLPVMGLRFGLALMAAAVLLTAMGLLDDAKGLRGRQKLLIQVLIAAFVVYVGDIDVEKFTVFDVTVTLGQLGPLFAILWVVGTINAVNLLDGADGMASIVGVTLGGALVALCVLLKKQTEAAIPAALVGALLAFLRYNLPPAKVFLGDAGSQLIGLVLGVSALQASLKGPTGVALMACIGIWSVPLFDAAIAILRRRLTGRSMYYPDRGHLHHRLIERGLAGNRLLLVVGALCLLTASGAVVSVAAKNEMFALAGVAVTLGVLVFGKLFGHSEVRELARNSARLAKSMVRTPQQVRDGGPVENSVRLRGTREWDRLWADLKAFAAAQNLSDARLIVHVPSLDEDFSATWRSRERPAYERTWKAELPLVSRLGTIGRLEIAGLSVAGPRNEAIAAILADLSNFETEILDLVESEAALITESSTGAAAAAEATPAAIDLAATDAEDAAAPGSAAVPAIARRPGVADRTSDRVDFLDSGSDPGFTVVSPTAAG